MGAELMVDSERVVEGAETSSPPPCHLLIRKHWRHEVCQVMLAVQHTRLG